MSDPERIPSSGGRTGKSQSHLPCATAGEVPLSRAWFRVARAMMFDETPIPELDALPLAQLRLLWTVRHWQDATMKDFSERLSVSQSTVTQLADRLVRRGLVERHTDPEDRRVVRLRVSAQGHALLERAEMQQRQTFRAVWDALSIPEQQEVLRALEALGKTAESVRAAQGRPLPSWSESCRQETPAVSEAAQPQPVVNLMARRVRGRAARG
ncbi:MAG TPA: MarR family transcriptional regulator [Chthonomonadaceae bacterium]|nr:MarR family transcriptional regulator [Chthonomonadaceae bacterium]